MVASLIANFPCKCLQSTVIFTKSVENLYEREVLQLTVSDDSRARRLCGYILHFVLLLKRKRRHNFAYISLYFAF